MPTYSPAVIAAAGLLLSIGCGDGSVSRLAALQPCDPAARPVAAVVGVVGEDVERDAPALDIWVLTASGESRRVTTDGRSSLPAMAADASGVLYAKFDPPTPGKPTVTSLWWLDLASGQHSLALAEAPLGTDPPALAPDGVTYAIRGRFAGSSNDRIGIGSRRSPAMPAPLTALPPTPENFGEHAPSWSPDAKTLGYVATMYDAPLHVPSTFVWLLDVAANTRRSVYTFPADTTPRGLSWSADGATILVTYTRNGEWHGVEVPVAGGLVRPIPILPDLRDAPVYVDAARNALIAPTVREAPGARGSLQRWRSGSDKAETTTELDVPEPWHVSIAQCALDGAQS